MRPAPTALALALAAGLTGCARSPFPPAVVPSAPGAGDWPDAGAAVLEDVAALELATESRPGDAPLVVATVDRRVRLKVLTPSGLAAASVELAADAWSAIDRVHARSVSPRGEITTMPPEAVTTASERIGGTPTPVRTLRFTVPGAAVGGLVEYRWRTTYADAAFLPTWVFGGRYPVARAELSIVHGDDVRLDYRHGVGDSIRDEPPLRRREGGRERLVFVEQDLPPFYPEPLAPHPARYAPWLAVTVTSAGAGRLVRHLETWEQVRRFLAELPPPAGGPLPTGTPPEVFRALRDSLRATAAPGLAGLRPTAAAALVRGAPACSRDASAALLTALSGGGVEAALALVASPAGPPVPHDLPGLYGFERAVVAVRASGPAADRTGCGGVGVLADPVCRSRDLLFLDVACSHCRYGELPPELAGGEAVVLWPSGAEWVSLPADPPEQHRTSLEALLAFDEAGTLRGRVDGRATGNAAASLARSAGSGSPDRSLAAALWGEAATVSGVEIIAGASAEQDLSLAANLSLHLPALGQHRFELRPVDLVGPALPVDRRPARRLDAVLPAPRLDDRVATIALPLGWAVSLPEAVQLTSAFAEYSSRFERRGSTLVYARTVRLRTPVVRAAEWPAFARFLEEAAAADARGARVSLGD